MRLVFGRPRHFLRLLLVPLAVFALLSAGVAFAWTLSYHNPLRNPVTGKLFSCADPSVAYAKVSYALQPAGGYVLVCTSGYQKNALPIYYSRDLVHWVRTGFVFPHGHQPWWAQPSSAHPQKGRYWAPEIFRIGGRWVVYFSAAYDAAKIDLQVPGARSRLPDGNMVIGAAYATSVSGPWHTEVLHYRGQFNGTAATTESPGPTIDPSMVQDPSTGQMYLFWADRPNQIWAGALSADGLTLDSQVRPVLKASEPFECDPRSHECTVEAPEPFFANGMFYLLYSGGSTWDSSYDVGVASSPNPLGPYVKRPQPILQQGYGFYSTGHDSLPVIGPDGKTYILYHARTIRGPSTRGSTRYLMLGRVGYAKGWPTISAGAR